MNSVTMGSTKRDQTVPKVTLEPEFLEPIVSMIDQSVQQKGFLVARTQREREREREIDR